MKAKNLIGFVAAILAFVFVLPAVSAFATIDYVLVDGTRLTTGGSNLAVFAGETLDLDVVFTSNANDTDVRVTARILGEPGIFETTERFDVLAGRSYSKSLTLDLPSNIDPDERFVLLVNVESNSQSAAPMSANLEIQRTSYTLEVLSVEADSKVEAGKTYALDVVVKNRGRQESEDTFVQASIPELGISKRIFLGDLAAVDEGGANLPDKFDSKEGRILLSIPANAKPGLYTVEVEAFNDDTETTVPRRVEIVGSGSASSVISSLVTKNFAVSEEATYSFSIVNSGDTIKVYTLTAEADEGLTVDLEETAVAVPAGSAKQVKLTAVASEKGAYNFKVGVFAADGTLVQEQKFVANVEGRAVGGNAVVVLTIVLAIIFVVLLVVLIVLLTRKPEKSENFGESYY